MGYVPVTLRPPFNSVVNGDNAVVPEQVAAQVVTGYSITLTAVSRPRSPVSVYKRLYM
jgi:hypothetical protein